MIVCIKRTTVKCFWGNGQKPNEQIVTVVFCNSMIKTIINITNLNQKIHKSATFHQRTGK